MYFDNIISAVPIRNVTNTKIGGKYICMYQEWVNRVKYSTKK